MLAEARGVLLVVDNRMATPVLQQPLRHGRTSGALGDQVHRRAGGVMGGVVVGRKDLIQQIYTFCRSTGPALSPFNAWVRPTRRRSRFAWSATHQTRSPSHNTESSPDRSRSAILLPSHPSTTSRDGRCRPGAARGLHREGGIDRGRRFLNALRLCSLTANRGDTRPSRRIRRPRRTQSSARKSAERSASRRDSFGSPLAWRRSWM
ncbi:MAG: PLP-dependent transferase [Gemmatimonadetes bacterium]|nr:PLP-dependent transferase [Gemmatimonadota bacterium]